jgi:hypothetical protein
MKSAKTIPEHRARRIKRVAPQLTTAAGSGRRALLKFCRPFEPFNRLQLIRHTPGSL